MCKCGSKRIMKVHGKCCDSCWIELPDGRELEGYVPEGLNVGSCDYIEFDLCMDCGQIQGKFPIEYVKEE